MKFFSRWPKQTFIEGLFVASLSILCAILTVLQYYWTGQLSDAAHERLNSTLTEQSLLLCQAFDAELLASCNELLPRGDELERRGAPAVHAERLHRWQASQQRPIFSRLAVAIPQGTTLKLFLLDQITSQLTPLAWPAEWAALQSNLQQRSTRAGAAPFKDPWGILRELPVVGGAPPSRNGLRGDNESEWMIFELDLTYLRETWMPELVDSYLVSEDHPRGEVAIATTANPPRTMYASTVEQPVGEPAISLPFNRLTHRAREGGGEVRLWNLRVWPRPGTLEAAVSRARWRNLGLACIPNVLMLVAGIGVVRYTRRSRLLAERQMNFVANVSHELRTPLTVIRGAGHNLLRGIVREQRQVDQYLRLIIQHADQLNGMIEQLLVLADARKKAVATETHQPVNLADVLDAAIAETLGDTRAAGCEIQATILRNLPLVRGDAAALRRVIHNLLTNAAKYGAVGGWIGVHTACHLEGPQTWVEVSVADRGPGVPEDEQEAIFEPFFRGIAAQSQHIRGTGLGLSLVREIVQAHGGTVSVWSQPWQQTVFTVRLPAIDNGKTRRLPVVSAKRTSGVIP